MYTSPGIALRETFLEGNALRATALREIFPEGNALRTPPLPLEHLAQHRVLRAMVAIELELSRSSFVS